MTLRDGLIHITSKAKAIGVVDLALRYNPGIRRKVRRTLAAFRGSDLARRRIASDRLSATILRHARQTRYGQDFGADLAAWPTLSKERLRAQPLDFVVPGWLRVPASTGGTTGMPLPLLRSLRSVAAEQAFLDDMLAPRGLSWARARVAVLRGDKIKDIQDNAPPFGKQTHWGRRLVLSSPHLTQENLAWYVDRLTGFRPDILCAWPNMMANLLMLLARSGRQLSIPVVLTSSSMLDAALYRSIQQVLGASVIDYYGLAERSVLAVRTGEAEWFFEPAYGRVELLPSDASPAADGQREMRIIATGYWNDAQPLVRYDTGDSAVVPADSTAADLEAIELGLAPFLGVAGRSNEFLIAPDGRRISGLSMITYEVHNVLQLQLVQQALDRLVIRVMAKPGFSPADRDRLLANARNKVPHTISITIELVDDLERSGRGKTPYIIRHCEAPLPPATLRAAE